MISILRYHRHYCAQYSLFPLELLSHITTQVRRCHSIHIDLLDKALLKFYGKHNERDNVSDQRNAKEAIDAHWLL